MNTGEKVELSRSELLPDSVTKRIQKVFPSFDPLKLEREDLEMWRAIKAGKTTPRDYKTYSRAVLKDEGYNTPTSSSSRLMFVDFLGDRIQEKYYNQEASDKKASEPDTNNTF